MAPGSNEEDVTATLTGKKKCVKIREENAEIIEIKEKHGPLYNAIPCMPVGVAALCCFINILVPGIGTFISAFTVFCGASTKISKRAHAFALNLLAAFLQMVTFIAIVGWIWSILWGMNFVQMAISKGDEQSRLPYYVRRQSSVDIP